MQTMVRSLRSTSVTHRRNERLTMSKESTQESLGPWDGDVHESLRDSDPLWADAYFRMSTHPWTNGVLSRKLVELIAIGLNASCTTLNETARAATFERHWKRAPREKKLCAFWNVPDFCHSMCSRLPLRLFWRKPARGHSMLQE
jgi:hypothetical protein